MEEKYIDDEASEKLKGKIDELTTEPCPRCKGNDWMLFDGYNLLPLSKTPKSMSLGGRALPVIVTACAKCGFLSQHVLGILGLMEELESEEKKATAGENA